VLTAAYTGLRASELHALRRRDVDLENGVIHVRRALKSWPTRRRARVRRAQDARVQAHYGWSFTRTRGLSLGYSI
jgi:integrase